MPLNKAQQTGPSRQRRERTNMAKSNKEPFLRKDQILRLSFRKRSLKKRINANNKKKPKRAAAFVEEEGEFDDENEYGLSSIHFDDNRSVMSDLTIEPYEASFFQQQQQQQKATAAATMKRMASQLSTPPSAPQAKSIMAGVCFEMPHEEEEEEEGTEEETAQNKKDNDDKEVVEVEAEGRNEKEDGEVEGGAVGVEDYGVEGDEANDDEEEEDVGKEEHEDVAKEEHEDVDVVVEGEKGHEEERNEEAETQNEIVPLTSQRTSPYVKALPDVDTPWSSKTVVDPSSQSTQSVVPDSAQVSSDSTLSTVVYNGKNEGQVQPPNNPITLWNTAVYLWALLIAVPSFLLQVIVMLWTITVLAPLRLLRDVVRLGWFGVFLILERLHLVHFALI